VHALAALKLQIEWGADEGLEEAPVNRLRSTPPPPFLLPQGEGETIIAPSPAQRGRVGEGEPPTRTTPAERALQSATAATSLEELRAAIAAFDGCALRDTASNLVFAEGDPDAALLFIGEPPGPEDDRSGKPFAGPAGAYLDGMLASIGLQRSQLMLAPLIPWRPPGDRPPSPAELAICQPFLDRLIELLQPRRLVLLGPLAARALLPQAASRRRQRGAWIETAAGIPALPTFSPHELMRSARERRTAWADLRLLRRTLDADGSAA
jgi:DNA polymerase